MLASDKTLSSVQGSATCNSQNDRSVATAGIERLRRKRDEANEQIRTEQQEKLKVRLLP
jgi:hypothetical protein